MSQLILALIIFLSQTHDFRPVVFNGQTDIVDYTTAFDLPVVVASTPWDSDEPAAAQDGKTLMVVWTEHKPWGTELMAGMTTDGVTWEWASIPNTLGGHDARVRTLWEGTFQVDFAVTGSAWMWRTYYQAGLGWKAPHGWQPSKVLLPVIIS